MENTDIKRTTRFSRNKTEDISNMIYGKIPPQARELEEAVIGAILIDKDAFILVSDILKRESFYVDAHATIFGAMKTLVNNSEPIDLLTVIEQLRKEAKLEEVGGAFYLSELTNKIASSANVEYHARIIIQKFIARELIRVGNDMIRDSYEDTTDVFDLKDKVSADIENINNSIESDSVHTGLYVINKIKKDLINPPEKPKHIKGLLEIKHLIGTVDCYAAKPGTGKTEILLESSLISALENLKVGILSLELKKDLLMAKMLHHFTGVFASSIIEQNVQNEYLERILAKDYSVMENIIIDDSQISNINIRSKIISLVKKYGCSVIWIDYIQLAEMVRLYGQTEVQAMEKMMLTLQRTAKELDICIIVLSQLKRGLEKPTMEDIRGGGIEQACSKIFLIEDPNIKTNYGKTWHEIDEDIRGYLEIINVKERFGDKGLIKVYYDKLRQKIYDWNDKPEPNQDYKKPTLKEQSEINNDIF